RQSNARQRRGRTLLASACRHEPRSRRDLPRRPRLSRRQAELLVPDPQADISKLRTTAISTDDLRDLIASIPGKKVLLIDACHAGAATVGYRATVGGTTFDMGKVVNDFSSVGSGVIVFAASTGTEWANEDFKWGRHGAFSKALIEAIGEGKASIDPSKPITTDMLDLYIEERVKAMTDGKQHPVMNRPVIIPDFPIAMAKP